MLRNALLRGITVNEAVFSVSMTLNITEITPPPHPCLHVSTAVPTATEEFHRHA